MHGYLKRIRPKTVCWCPYLPRERIDVHTTVHIIQHPFEVSRCLQTARILEHGLAPGKCTVYVGKRISYKKHPRLETLLKSPETLLLYPGPKAVDIATMPQDRKYNIVLLDGTWPQAGGIYHQNTMLHCLKQVKLCNTGTSKYVIRTQPSDGCLSTLETAVTAIAILENRPDIIEPLTRPMSALCDFQMEHGAVMHHSKQYLIDNGLYKKQNSTGDNQKSVNDSNKRENEQNNHLKEPIEIDDENSLRDNF
ncbi:unnamed protein product [Owenia fusiformis]|uniref:tRNA-uridine aminocarboxypropyltransferase n=1 Tax=Owenia fusiformis TaxID=6347 RepID=A0A8S4PU73_OWEFU|nr:unnamed protein product [Owenia fusiformis]